MQHLNWALFALLMKDLSKFAGDERASFISASYRFPVEAQLQWGQRQIKSTEKTLLCFHLNLFDVTASGDLDIISCPSSKRHQTRCCIHNRIIEPEPKPGVFSVNIAFYWVHAQMCAYVWGTVSLISDFIPNFPQDKSGKSTQVST